MLEVAAQIVDAHLESLQDRVQARLRIADHVIEILREFAQRIACAGPHVGEGRVDLAVEFLEGPADLGSHFIERRFNAGAQFCEWIPSGRRAVFVSFFVH